MNSLEILEHFCLLSGLDEEEAVAWLRLCNRCANWLRNKLRDPALEEKNAPLLASVAAEVAYAKYVEICASREAESFSAGDITVRSYGETSVKAARNVAKDALASISDLLTDQAFLFRKC